MITLQEVNHMDAAGRLRLGDLRMHQQTPFAEIAAKHETIIFVDGDDMVPGELVHDPSMDGSATSIGRRRTTGNRTRPPSLLAGDRPALL